jgi:hypothetical protein
LFGFVDIPGKESSLGERNMGSSPGSVISRVTRQSSSYKCDTGYHHSLTHESVTKTEVLKYDRQGRGNMQAISRWKPKGAPGNATAYSSAVTVENLTRIQNEAEEEWEAEPGDELEGGVILQD